VTYDAHINVERCAQKKVIRYLHKYMHKGPIRATFVIEDNVNTTDAGGHPQYKEVGKIKQYLDGTYISSDWRIFELKVLIVIRPSKCYSFTCPDNTISFSMMMKIWITLLIELNIALVCSWDDLKLIKFTLKQMAIHMPNSQNIMFGIKDSKNELNDKNRYALVDFFRAS